MTRNEIITQYFNGYEQEELRVKELFIAQYWGQRVLFYNSLQDSPFVICAADFNSGLGKYYLQLRTVSQLDADQLLKVGIKAFPMFVPFPEKDYDTLRKLALTVLDRGHLSWVTHQALVRYGAIVPFEFENQNGDLIILSVENILALNWAVVVEN